MMPAPGSGPPRRPRNAAQFQAAVNSETSDTVLISTRSPSCGSLKDAGRREALRLAPGDMRRGPGSREDDIAEPRRLKEGIDVAFRNLFEPRRPPLRVAVLVDHGGAHALVEIGPLHHARDHAEFVDETGLQRLAVRDSQESA